MRILLASSEVHPYSKTGGLADMVGALAKSLAEAGHKVGLVTPLYRGIAEKCPAIKPLDYALEVPMGNARAGAGVLVHELSPNLTIYFIEHRDFFDRTGIYGERGADYVDNAERFIFFSKCVVHLARHLPWQPQMVHVHDWQVGLVPLMILHQRLREGWGNPPASCLTIHNLAYQGVFPRASYELANLPWDYFHIEGAEFHGMVNCLKAAICFSDVITTVSPRYAREILTEGFGCGLDDILRKRQASLAGILNGVDVDEWNTDHNPFLKPAYTREDLRGKAELKRAVQAEFGLEQNPDVPLFGTVSRLADQKGLDIELGALQEMLSARMQFVLLGSGDPVLESAYRALPGRFSGKAGVRVGFDLALSHRLEAACDFYLMPSRFEPCGLNQMYSLIYGTIPIVRRTGGLDDSVTDIVDERAHANGIKFNEASARALSKAIRKALALYEDKAALDFYRRNAMNCDFTWAKTREEYLRIYSTVVRR
ncbi:MAG: glycogen synthase GlgA [Verrucomicrobia bacterium]|nr:glycogen synthase GlgA [Verrucomicrobiota bacterium]